MIENPLLGDAEVCVSENLNLVHMVCNQMIRSLHASKIEYEDAFQEGCEALYNAYLRFDGRGKFSTQAVKYIRNKIIKVIYLANMKKRKILHHTVSLSKIIRESEAEDLTLESILQSETDWTAPHVEDFYKVLTDVEREVLDYMIEGYKHVEIAKMMGYSRQNVSRIALEIAHMYAMYHGIPYPKRRSAPRLQAKTS